jgi:putative ABC transport system permease protein
MLSDLRYRLKALFRGRTLERELDEELQFHLEQHAAADERAGVPREEARRRARLAFGGVDRASEASRDGRGIWLVEIAWRDLRYAMRTLRRSPAFTLVAIISLTLGIGANTAMFQLLNALVLRPLPIPQPQQLVEVRLPERDLDRARGNMFRYPAMSHPLWERLRDRQDAFSGMLAYADENVNLSPTGEVRRAQGLWVSGSYFSVLGVTPAAGRVFTPADDRRGCGMPGAVVSHDFWQRELGGNAEAIGRTLTVNAVKVDVIGVAPAGFFGVQVGHTFDVALPLCSMDALRPGARQLDSGTSWWLTVIGRLKPGMTLDRASAHLRTIAPDLFEASLPADYPAASVNAYLTSSLEAQPAGTGLSYLREEYTSALLLLLAMTGFILLIACVNLTNLMLARGAIRRRELSLRLALGASRGRLLSQLLSESLLIAGVSAAAGIVVAHTLSQLLVSLLTTTANQIVLSVAADWRVLAFMCGVATLACLLLGLTPALRASRGAPNDVLKTGTRGGTSDHESLGLRRALVVAQVAVSLVLVVGALLFVRSFRNLLSEPLGFEREGVLIVNAGLPSASTRLAPEASAALKRDILARLRTAPGVMAAAQANIVPLSGGVASNAIWAEGASQTQSQSSFFSRVSTGYFATLGMTMIGGRDFDERDTVSSPKAAVVNESFLRLLPPGASPIGRRFWIETTPSAPETLYEIVGVVRDAKYRRLKEEPSPVAFLSLAQHPSPEAAGTWLVRSSLTPDALVPAVRRVLLEANPNLRFIFRVLDTDVRDSMVRERVMAALSGLFGLLAGLLAAVGLHGVVAYMVARRRREIGIRLALGASRRTIVSSVLRESSVLVGVGLGLGVICSLLLTRTARTLLFNLSPDDAATIALAAGGLAMIAVIASYLPARRAAHVDPMTTLKDE